MRKLLFILLLPCIASAQGVIGAWTITPGTVDPGGGGGGGTPGGNSGDWQYNNAGSFGGYAPAAGWVDLFGTPSSENLADWLTDETGNGLAVFSNAPTIAAPTLTGTTTVATMNTTTLNASAVEPTTNDGAALGSTSKQFSDLFLAEGGVINWDNGDATITQAGNVVTVAGAALANSSPGTAANSVATIDATQTFTAKTYQVSGALGTDDTLEGNTISGLTAGATIAQWEAVYVGGSSTYLLADANGTNTYPARGLAVAAYSSTNAAIIVTRGTVRNDAWNWTPGGTIYISGTPGALTQTAPITSGDKVQAVGYALTADIAFFDFDSTYVTVQ